MKRITISATLVALAMVGLTLAIAQAQTSTPVSIAVDLDPNSATGIRIEGLVSDRDGRLYTSDLTSRTLYRFTPSSNNLQTLGVLPRTATGMAFDSAGNLYMASGDVVLRISSTTLQSTTITATDVVTFATGVTGANGLAFDASGKLYISGGATGNIYVATSSGVTSTFASGLISERQEQRISTNGLAFWTDGKLYSSNTGTGSINRIAVNADGTVGQIEQWVKDPLLLGADGITFAANGDLYVASNERNAIVRVSPQGQVTEVTVNNNNGPLEFPASPAFSDNALYASNFDVERGANAPSAPGVGGSLARIDVATNGLPLPVVASQPSQAVTATPGQVASPQPATPQVAPTEVAPPPPIPSEPQPEPTPIAESPGMPSTGGGPLAFLSTLLICGLAIIAGIALRRKTRAEN